MRKSRNPRATKSVTSTRHFGKNVTLPKKCQFAKKVSHCQKKIHFDKKSVNLINLILSKKILKIPDLLDTDSQHWKILRLKIFRYIFWNIVFISKFAPFTKPPLIRKCGSKFIKNILFETLSRYKLPWWSFDFGSEPGVFDRSFFGCSLSGHLNDLYGRLGHIRENFQFSRWPRCHKTHNFVVE